jgi:hypothetical protein
MAAALRRGHGLYPTEEEALVMALPPKRAPTPPL